MIGTVFNSFFGYALIVSLISLAIGLICAVRRMRLLATICVGSGGGFCLFGAIYFLANLPSHSFGEKLLYNLGSIVLVGAVTYFLVKPRQPRPQ